MKKYLIVAALLAAGHAYADTTASSQQTATTTSTAQGTIQFSQSPENTRSTVNNVSAPILGSYAFAASQMSCGSTTQGGFAVAGFSGVFGSSKDSATCVLEVAASELTRQSTVDAENAAALRNAAIGVRCQISEEVYLAMQDAGFTCKRKPREMHSRTDDQPANYKIAGE